jgi:dihydroorotase (multifunctional complex type)
MTQIHDLVLANADIQLTSRESLSGWLAVSGGTVAAVGEGAPPEARSVLDCTGKHVLPGGIDIHVHFRDPGDPDEETFANGTLAAAFGGITTVIDMPNTGDLVISPADYVEKRDYLAGSSWVDFGMHALLMDSADYVDELCRLGVAGMKWLMGYETLKGVRAQPTSNARLRETLIAAAKADLLVGVHAESMPWMKDLIADLKEQGRNDVRAHLDSRPPFVEAIAVAEVCILAAEFGTRMHIHHLTSDIALRTAASLRAALGIGLTIETCPSYLFLTHDDVEAQGSMIQVNPPMRSRLDQDAMWMGILRGTIDSVGSDHAPRRHSEKLADSIWDIPPGVIAVETMLPLLLNEVATGRLGVDRFVSLVASKPAELVRLHHRKGALLPGFDADITVVDLDAATQITADRMHSTLTFSPYEGRELRGAITDVLVRGRPVVSGGELAASEPFGEHVPSSYASQVTAVD